MNKKIVLAFVASMGMLMASAQDIYKVESLVGSDLNGTARFVGMGGAMSALGADLSTMNSNPAGIGMYRRNDIAATLSLTTQPNGQSFMDIDKSRVSFDQVGLVYTTKIGSKLQFVNFGFNYQKRRNFKNYIGIDNAATGGLSQARTMQNTAFMSNGFVDLATDDGASMVPPFTYLGYTTQMLGKGMLTLTGQLGDVMKESCQAALSYVRTNGKALGIPENFLDKTDLHVHFPEGAVPKDGPSAGVTILSALVSLLKGIRVRGDTAMTGEVTLRGLVLPVGGIKEKVLAAHRAGIKRLILPERNRKDVQEVPAQARNEIEFHYVTRMDDVLRLTLERDPFVENSTARTESEEKAPKSGASGSGVKASSVKNAKAAAVSSKSKEGAKTVGTSVKKKAAASGAGKAKAAGEKAAVVPSSKRGLSSASAKKASTGKKKEEKKKKA